MPPLFTRRGLLLAPLVTLAACGCRRRIPVGPGEVSLAAFSMNLSAGDLLDPATAAGRVALYLDEIAAAGYRRQVRVILPHDWGPRIEQLWFPVLRARGFRVLAILGQERRDTVDDLPAFLAWVDAVLPRVRADLLGVQVLNEPAYRFTAREYAALHRRVAARIRELAPGVPIVAGDFGVPARGQNTLAHWQAAVAAGADDYDVLSLHLTGMRKEAALRDLTRRVRDFAGPRGRTWITEGDWGHLPFLRAEGLDVEENFVYTWNDDLDPTLIRRPGGRLR